jgi:hypothetical protein
VKDRDALKSALNAYLDQRADAEVEIREPMCMICIHTFGHDYGRCAAFPQGIPPAIMGGRNAHQSPWPKSSEYPEGDRGIQFAGPSPDLDDEDYDEEK